MNRYPLGQVVPTGTTPPRAPKTLYMQVTRFSRFCDTARAGGTHGYHLGTTPQVPTMTTTTEPPRGSAARQLQHAITTGGINPDLLDTATLAFVVVLLAPHYGKTAAIAPSHHRQQHQQRLTLYVKDRPDMAPPAGNDTDPTDAGGLLSHKKDLFR